MNRDERMKKDNISFKEYVNSKRKCHGHLAYKRTPIEMESPEEFGYDKIRYNLAESSVPDLLLGDLNLDLAHLSLSYIDHLGNPQLRQYIAEDAIIPNIATGMYFFIMFGIYIRNGKTRNAIKNMLNITSPYLGTRK